MFETLYNLFTSQLVDVQPRGIFGADRHKDWPKTRRIHIIKYPYCMVCGYTKSLNVHHILPFHLYPELELDLDNLITLGEACPSGNHHFLFGHFLDWKKYNPQVVEIAKLFYQNVRKTPSQLFNSFTAI